MLKIRVPASSANMGAGFDCLGVALSVYNYIYVNQTGHGLVIEAEGEGKDKIAKDEKNLVYQSMKKVFEYAKKSVDGLYIKLENNIPLSRGLGSSSACIVGGMTAANALLGNPLTDREILNLALLEEKHPDNITPCLVGGFTASMVYENEVYYIKKDVPDKISFLLIIPDFTLKTKKSREILPQNILLNDAAFNISHSTIFALGMYSENFDIFKVALKDKIHQPYRSHFISDFDDILKKCEEFGALGAYLSGSGSTIAAILYDSDRGKVENGIRKYLDKTNKCWKVITVKADNLGVTVEKIQ